MTKADITAQIAQKTGISQADVKIVVEALFHSIIEANKEGEEVHFRQFGNFKPRKKAAKVARNIAHNTAMLLPACYVPSFAPSQHFVCQVKEALKPH